MKADLSIFLLYKAGSYILYNKETTHFMLLTSYMLLKGKSVQDLAT